MYRISIKAPKKKADPNAKGVWTSGYFGPCFIEDKVSDEQLTILNDPSQYVNIKELFGDPTRKAKLQQLISEANIGNYQDWARFRDDKKYVLQMCIKGKSGAPKRLHFLRPEYAAFLNLPNVPIFINTWIQLKNDDERGNFAQNFIKENYNPVQRDKSKEGEDVVKVRYTGNNEELLEYQRKNGNVPVSVNVWGVFLEGIKSLQNKYNVDRHLRKIANNQRLSPEEKQAKYNETLEQSYNGLLPGVKLYRYIVDEESDDYDQKIASLTVKHKGRGKSRNIAKDGFTLKEWQDLVLGGNLPIILEQNKSELSQEQISNILNGVVNSVQRTVGLPKIKYTGNNPQTLRKMELTGLKPNTPYTQGQWYESLQKVYYVESEISPINQEEQKKYKKHILEMPLLDEYQESLKNLDIENEYKELHGQENGQRELKRDLARVGQLFRKRLERAGLTDVKKTLSEIVQENTDPFAVQQFIKDTQLMDNAFIDNLYVAQLGSSGEQVMRDVFHNGLKKDSNLKFQRTLSVNVTSPDDGKSYLLIFDGAILTKEGNIVMLFEYQGQQHYAFNERHYKSYEDFQQRLYRDKLKLDFCKQYSIPLFSVNNNLNSAEATKIYKNLLSSGSLNRFVPKGTKDDYKQTPLRQENIESWVESYADNLVVAHFRPIMNMAMDKDFSILIPRIERIVNDLSKLMMIAINSKSNTFQDTSFMQGFDKNTLLDIGHKKIVDSFNQHFGDKYRMDYQDNVTYVGQILKPRQPEIKEQTPIVQEMALMRPKKKRYKIIRIK